jgi:tellurite resistance protein
MNSSKFGKPDVAKLYRRFTRSRAAAAPLPEVDALLALADGQQSDETERLLADVARSGMHADLLRFTRALAPESARLGTQLDRALERPAADHARRARHTAHAATTQRGWLRIAASVAAGLVVAIAVWTVQRTNAPTTSTAALTTSKSDRIFAAVDDRGSVAASGSDRIFHADFKPDEIFHGKFSGG